MGDDLVEGPPEEIPKEGGFGAGGGNGPGSATRARGQTNVALSAEGMADQKCRVSRRWRNLGRSGWERDCLRCRMGDRGECTCERESGAEQARNSRCLCLLTKV